MVAGRVAHPRGKVRWTSAAAVRLTATAGTDGGVEKAVAVVAARLLEGVQCRPTDLHAVLEKLGARMEPRDVPLSGWLERGANGYTIIYDETLSPGRKAFTVAHEIAHIIFDSTGPQAPRTGRELERLCDMIATQLLMPADLFRETAGPRPSIATLFQLSRAFATSLATTALRLCDIGSAHLVFGVDEHGISWKRGLPDQPPSQVESLIREVLRTGAGEGVVSFTRKGSARHVLLEGRALGPGGQAVFCGWPVERALGHRKEEDHCLRGQRADPER